jgi:hypothetical protein
MSAFSEYKKTAAEWITVLDTEFFPDFLDQARVLYTPVIERFIVLVGEAKSSEELLRTIAGEKLPIRTQLQRVFRKYVSPSTSVEMLKKVTTTEDIIKNFGNRFRSIKEVAAKLKDRPVPDEALIALLNEYKDRGQKGYELTEAFFQWFESKFPGYEITGPVRAGRDIMLNEALENYPKKTPADILVKDSKGRPLLVGFARYDSDRGGAQEDDRTSGNNDKITGILEYNRANKTNIKILFLNDGPGLLLGSMWNDYCGLETDGAGRTMVSTLKMLDSRLTEQWLLS